MNPLLEIKVFSLNYYIFYKLQGNEIHYPRRSKVILILDHYLYYKSTDYSKILA